jgi:hypothetical protein
VRRKNIRSSKLLVLVAVIVSTRVLFEPDPPVWVIVTALTLCLALAPPAAALDRRLVSSSIESFSSAVPDNGAEQISFASVAFVVVDEPNPLLLASGVDGGDILIN